MKFFDLIRFLFSFSYLENALSIKFDDSLVFRINFPGRRSEDKFINIDDVNLPSKDENSLLITSIDNEKYNCLLPISSTDSYNSESYFYDGPSPLQLLRPLFAQLVCSYRIEQYWTYELCHGRFLRQYHEESTHKGNHLQEYILGLYDVTNLQEDDPKEMEKWEKSDNIPVIKIEGQEVPYLELNMTDGTKCDLNEQARACRILYGCGDKKHELYSLKETSTCEYEVVILSSLLCKHPNYRIKSIQENDIYCHAVNDSPNKPLRLLSLENENNEIVDEKKLYQKEKPELKVVNTPHDPKIIQDFLNGDYCLHGGIGWWKYEFCYGKKVEQYHEEKGKHRITVLLGSWNIENHIEWIDQHISKKPKKGIIPRQVSHFYSEGTICDVTGKPRQVEVKLKCKEVKGHPDVVSLSLSEPDTCEYILGVESPVICPLLQTVDENGLFHSKL